jgi:type IV secretory pathway TraG/TraD family ATPase VirD4
MLILPTGHRPIYGRQILYFEDQTFNPRSKIKPPLRGDQLLRAARFHVTP